MARLLGRGSVTMWAWAVSLGLHILLLAVFGVVRFSQSSDRSLPAEKPQVSVAQINKVIERAQVRPKPKVEYFPVDSGFHVNRERKIVMPAREYAYMEPELKTNSDITVEGTAGLLPGGRVLEAASAFFGQVSAERKICYVVDCSGSMHGRFSLVRDELKRSISGLEADRYFYIIFFLEGDKLLESGKGKLVRATPGSKSAAFDFIDSARPSGQTNAYNALRRGMAIRDDFNSPAGLICFLTDGFDLEDAGAADFADIIGNLRKELAPGTRINTIGLQTEATDCGILQAVATESGGKFSNVGY